VILGEPGRQEMYAEGASINITCLAAGGNPPPTVAWYKEPSSRPLPILHHRQVGNPVRDTFHYFIIDR
jgi:hypothetical protein